MNKLDTKLIIPEFKYIDSAYFQTNFNIENGKLLAEFVQSIAFSEKENKLYITLFDGSYKDKKADGTYADGKCSSEILSEEKDNISKIIVSTFDKSGVITDAKVFSIKSIDIMPIKLHYDRNVSILLACTYE